MKNLGFLFSVLAFMMLAQNSQSVADDKCTDVTVTYTGLDPRGLPDSVRQMDAWYMTHCGQKTADPSYWKFELPDDAKGKTTWKVSERFEQGQKLWLEPGGTGNANCKIIIDMLSGSNVNVECKYDAGICQGCIATLVKSKI